MITSVNLYCEPDADIATIPAGSARRLIETREISGWLGLVEDGTRLQRQTSWISSTI